MKYKSFLLTIFILTIALHPVINTQAKTGNIVIPEFAPVGDPAITIQDQKAGELVLRIDFPPVRSEETSEGTIVRMGKLSRCPSGAGYLLPSYTRVIPGDSKWLKVQTLEVNTGIHPLERPPIVFAGDHTLDSNSPQESRLPFKYDHQGWAQIKPLGEYRGVPCSQLYICTAKWYPQRKEITYLKSIKLRLHFPTKAASGMRPANLSRILHDLSGALPIPAFVSANPFQPPVSNSSSQEKLKLFVSQPGMYHLSYGELSSWGVNISGDPRTFRMENRGEEIPIYVFGEADGRFDESDFIEFWGEELHDTYSHINPEIYSDLYTDVNVYWLSWGGSLGSRLIEESGEIVQVDPLQMVRPVSYPYKLHAEENQYYNRLSQVGPDSLKEHWFYDAGISAPEQNNYVINLPHPDINSLDNTDVRVTLMGLTYSIDPDNPNNNAGYHHAYIYLNDMTSPSGALQAGTSDISAWRGQTSVFLEALGTEGIRTSSLVNGANTVSILCPGDTRSGTNDKILLNWLEITYPRLYKASSDYIKFAPPENIGNELVDFKLTEFTSSQVDIYKLGQSKIINAEITPYYQNENTYYEVHFQDHPYGDRDYIALMPGAKLDPDSVELDPGSDIIGELSAGSPVKLLVVTHKIFDDHPDLDDYISRRNSELGRTELVFIDDVFDELSYGIYTPQAIKDLLLALPTPPEFLLLVGDASYDTRNTLWGFGGNLIPAMYVQTKAYGAIASDFWYARLDDDMIPDVVVGRISVRDDEELTAYLEKLEEYETDTQPGKWRNTHLFVTGSVDQSGNSFLPVSQEVISRLEENIFVERLGTEPVTSPFYGGTNDLINLFEEGALAIDYNGHGAGSIWSDNSLFRLENLPQLSNQGLYPFITNFTCFIGAFDNPQPGSILGEEFIFAEEAGAIAVLASSGLGWFYNGAWLQETLADLLYDNPELRLGEIVHAAKIAYYAYYGQGGSVESFDTIHLMNLLGDPSLRLAFADHAENTPQATPEFASYGEQINISLAGDYAGYQGRLRVYDDYDYPALQFGEPLEIPLIPTSNGIAADFPLPTLSDSTYLMGGSYRLSLWNSAEPETYTAVAPLYLLEAYNNASFIDSLTSIPSPVDIWDSFGFRAKILDANGIQSAWAHFRIETDQGVPIVEHDSLEMLPSQPTHWYETTALIDTTVYSYEAGDRIILWVDALNDLDSLTLSSEYIFYILNRMPDPEWIASSLRMDIRDGAAAILIDVENVDPGDPIVTGVFIDSLDVEFYWYPTDSTIQSLGSTVLMNIAIDSTATAYIASPFDQPSTQQIEVRLNSLEWIQEINPTEPYLGTLRINHFNVSAQSGTVDTLVIQEILDIVEIELSGDSTTFDTTFLSSRVFLPPDQSGTEGGVIVFKMHDDFTLSNAQDGISFALHNAAMSTLPGNGIEINFLGDIAARQNDLWISMDLTRYDTLIDVEEVYLHYQEPGQFVWQLDQDGYQQINSGSSGENPSYRFFTTSYRSGYYTLLQNGDETGPAVEISVEGQIYTEGGYVPSRPKISAIVQDPGGVNFEPGSLLIKVDGDSTAAGEVTVTSAADGQVMTLSYRPNNPFDVGSHVFSIRAEDMFGNADSSSINFEVFGDFRLDFVGNYPNPFKNKTYFAYRLTEQTTRPVEIRIYTVSGRLIRTLHSDSAEEINYGEIYWDGRDKDGELIANGVYFYKLIAHRGGDKIETTMKLAKLR